MIATYNYNTNKEKKYVQFVEKKNGLSLYPKKINKIIIKYEYY